MLFCFCFSACCLVLFWIIMFDFFLLCILFSCCCCFFLFLLLWYFVIFDFWLPIKKHLWKFGNCKKKKMKNAEKWTFWQEQLAQVCSQIVSFFLFCVSLNFACFAENTIKIGVSAKKFKKHTKNKNPSVKNWSKLALKTGPSMLCNKIGPVFNATNGSFFCFFFFLFLKNPLLSAGRTRFSKTKKTKQQKKWASF